MILSATSSNDIHKCTQAALRWPAQTGLNYTEQAFDLANQSLMGIVFLHTNLPTTTISFICASVWVLSKYGEVIVWVHLYSPSLGRFSELKERVGPL